MNETLSRDRIIEILSELSDVQIQARKGLSVGIEPFEANPNDEVVLTRKELEDLLVSQKNINIYAFHSSGINNIGDHSSS
jgi:hypothetical protein